MKGIDKSFTGTHALKKVDLTLFEGEVLGLIGENGAGKSTLMKVLAGAHLMDEGQIFINGKEVHIVNTDQSQHMGIGIIYQELSLFPHLNAVENVFIHREHTHLGLLSRKQMRDMAKKVLAEELDAHFDVNIPISKLRLAERQLVEIARALAYNNRIIVMDEPTAALEDTEKELLFATIRRLKHRGVSIIFVSHHLDEIMEICDRAIILRDGEKIADEPIGNLSVDKIIDYMIGKSVKQQYPKEIVDIGMPFLEVKGLTKQGFFENVSFSLRKGEILGLAGLAGCGKNEVARALFGVLPYDCGTVYLNGRQINIKNVNQAMNKKMAFLPADRKMDGLFLGQSIKWNITIASMKQIIKGLISGSLENNKADHYINELGIKLASSKSQARSLSGGNQQKVMLARWLMTQAEVLIMEEPTRGIDVNAKTEVYRLLAKCVKEGKSVIIVSSESPELLGICDRIMVMCEGETTAILDAKDADETILARYSQSGGNNIAI